jgi:Zn-finger nucleic acid-binding protein
MDLALGARLSEALDHDLKGLMQSLSAHASGRAETHHAIVCPECHAPLQRYFASSQRLELDHCPQHGTWFDRDEAARLAQALSVDRAYGAYNQGPQGMGTGAKVALAAGGVAAAGAAAYAAHEMLEQRQRRYGVDTDVVADVAETSAELAADGVFEGGMEFAGDAAGAGMEAAGVVAEAGGEAVGGIFEMLGGIFDAFG